MASLEFPSLVPEPDDPQWKLEYESALRETDHKTLFKQIEVAEAAILNSTRSPAAEFRRFH
jgi:hypothetical protein